MAKQIINIGTSANSGTGDPLRTSFTKANENFTELYNRPVFSGSYADLTNKPTLFNGSYTDLTNKPTIPTDVNQLADADGLLGGSTNLGDFKISGSALGTKAVEGDGWGGYSMYLTPNGEGAAYIAIPNDDSATEGGYLTLANYPTDSGGVRIEASTNNWTFKPNGDLQLPQGGIIAETSITNNPTIVIAPAQPDVESQVLFIKGGGPGYINTQNGISIQTIFNQYAIGDTASFNIWTPDNSNSTLYWWLEPAGGGVAPITPVSGTVLINEFGASDASIDVEVLSTAPFRIYVGPTDGVTSTAGISVSVNGESVVTDYHLHLTTGDLTETSIILGTDDHNVRTTVNGGIEITTPNESNNVWQFGSNGDLELPANGGIVFDRANTTIRVGMGFHIASGEGVSIEAIDETDPDNLVYNNWYFSPDGSLTLPGAVVKSTVAKTGGNSDPQGNVVTVTLTPTTAAWTNSTYFVGSGGIDINVTVLNGTMTLNSVSSTGGTYRVGDTVVFDGGLFGGQPTTDDVTLTVDTITTAATYTAIDLTKSINKLADGAYTLADGTDGQIMYLVMQNGGTGNIQVFVDNARVGQGLYTNYPLFFNSGIITLIFTDGAWQQSGGGWD